MVIGYRWYKKRTRLSQNPSDRALWCVGSTFKPNENGLYHDNVICAFIGTTCLSNVIGNHADIGASNISTQSESGSSDIGHPFSWADVRFQWV